MLTYRDFEFLKIIGTGTSGQVFLARQKTTGKFFALKRLHKQVLKKHRQLDNICNEMQIMREIGSCPLIVKLLHTIESEKYVFIIMEYVNGGELFFYLRKYHRFTEYGVLFFSAEILAALKHLHDRNIIYRDLKPENVLISKEGHIKLADFGFATRANENLFTICGTPEYMAPEKILGYGDGKVTDYWSLGCIIYEMIFGNPPFFSKDTNQIYNKVLYETPKFVKEINPVAKDLLERLLVKEKNRRLGFHGIEEIMEHPFFRDVRWEEVLRLDMRPPFEPELFHFENTDPNSVVVTQNEIGDRKHSYRRLFR